MIRAVCLAHWYILLILFSLKICGARLDATNFMPMFSQKSFAHRKSSYYLADGEEWVPNGITQIVVLRMHQPLPIRVALFGSQAGLKSVSLLYKCSSTDSTFSEVSLDISVLPSNHCRSLRPFTVESVSAANYQLSLKKSNTLPFEQVFRHSLELRLRVSFYHGTLESASLFIFCFETLYNTIFIRGTHNPLLLTERSILYLDYLYPYFLIKPPSHNYGYIQLLHPELVNAIREASPMLRSLLSFTVYYANECGLATLPRLVVISSGHGKVLGKKLPNDFVLNVSTGFLYVTAWETFKMYLQRKRNFNKPVICLDLSLAGDVWAYRYSFIVHRVLNDSHIAKTKTFNSDVLIEKIRTVSHVCYYTSFTIVDQYSLQKVVAFSEVLLPANLRQISLECPIVCSGVAYFRFRFTGSHCSGSVLKDSAKRPPCSRFYDTSSKSCRINLLGPTSIMHNGNYTVFVGGLTYTYQVTVVSLPIFTPETINHEITVFSAKMGLVTMNCSVMHSDISHVEVTPRFRLQEKFKAGGSWQLVEPREFGAMVLDGDPHGVSVTTIRSENRTDVVIRLSSKGKDWWRLWKAAFECSASASQKDAQRFGLSEFHVRAYNNFMHFVDLDFKIYELNSRGHQLHSVLLLHAFAVLGFIFTAHGPRL